MNYLCCYKNYIIDQKCELINFDLGDTINTKLTCKTPAAPAPLAEYPGGRGINLIKIIFNCCSLNFILNIYALHK